MTQYFFVDESGDAGLGGQASSSSYFVITMVQLPNRVPLQPLVNLRKTLQLPSAFEFKYHKTTEDQKDCFFRDVMAVHFRTRAVVLNKRQIDLSWRTLSPQELTTELLIGLTFRASELDISNEILVIDGGTPAFCRHLRVSFTERCKQEQRIRPFKNIIGANSRNEDGLQMADMIAGAIRLYAMGRSREHFYSISERLVDLWELP
ncbi:MAG: DUF3800 domain-containing protein [Anaerolineales bacterium]|nr:DUF3800 domain-containing protein [Anaerolineales bacterium]